MLAEIIMLIIVQFVIEVTLILSSIFVEKRFNVKKNGDLCQIWLGYFRMPTLLVGMYIGSYWDLIFIPTILYLFLRRIFLPSVNNDGKAISVPN